MRKRMALCAFIGVSLFAFASCAEEKKVDAPAAEAPKAVEPEGPFYELTKDEVTSHADWTSKNVMLLGAKIGDKTTAVEKKLGKLDAGNTVGDHIRTVYEGSSYAVYTYRMTGELQKIEVFTRHAGEIADPKFRKLLSTGSVDYMREAFGQEEAADLNFNTTGMEFIYDAKGFRFARYDVGGRKFDSLIFSKMAKKK